MLKIHKSSVESSVWSLFSEDSKKKSFTEGSKGEPHCSVFFFAKEHCSDFWVAELHSSDFRRFDGRLDVESKALRLEFGVACLSELCSKSSKPHCSVFFFAEEHCSDFWVAELHRSDYRRLECEVVSLSELSNKLSESSMNCLSRNVEIWSCKISKDCPNFSTWAVVKLLLGSFVDKQGGSSSPIERSISLSSLWP